MKDMPRAWYNKFPLRETILLKEVNKAYGLTKAMLKIRLFPLKCLSLKYLGSLKRDSN